MATTCNISIIIPCYNIEVFVSNAVNSVLNQTNQSWEIILINDGSTDNTLQELTKLAEKDSRIKLIDKENGGLSSARNAGLEAAQGEYVLFLDGDDWLHSDSLEVLYNKAKNEDLDILIGDTLFYYSDTRVEWVYRRPSVFNEMGVKSGVDYFVQLKKYNCYAPMSVNQIYKNSFLKQNKLKFYDGLINEDELWTPQCFYYAKRVNCTDLAFYYYLQRENSIMNSTISLKRINHNIFIANNLIDLVDHRKDDFKSWIWVKAYELYYRALTIYNSQKLETEKAHNYNLIHLILSGISLDQKIICLRYLKKTYPRNLLYKAYLLCCKFLVKFIKN